LFSVGGGGGVGLHPFHPSQAHFYSALRARAAGATKPSSLALLNAQVINSIQTQAAGFEETFLCVRAC